MLLARRFQRFPFAKYAHPHFIRSLASIPPKSTAKLVAELRKLTDTSIVKAKEALVASNNDLDAALQWLEEDLDQQGIKKASKVQGRLAGEGLISTVILSKGYNGIRGTNGRAPLRAAIVELNCETDFVARNELFSKLAANITYTAAFLAEQSLDSIESVVIAQPLSSDVILDAPLLSASDPSARTTDTVRSAIQNTIAKVGEKIDLRRVAVSVLDEAVNTLKDSSEALAFRVASYTHGGLTPTQGRIGTISTLRLNLPKPYTFENEDFLASLGVLERSLARQISGFETRSISTVLPDKESTLYEQPFAMFPGSAGESSVKDALLSWAKEKLHGENGIGAVNVWEFMKWTLGEPLGQDQIGLISDNQK